MRVAVTVRATQRPMTGAAEAVFNRHSVRTGQQFILQCLFLTEIRHNVIESAKKAKPAAGGRSAAGF